MKRLPRQCKQSWLTFPAVYCYQIDSSLASAQTQLPGQFSPACQPEQLHAHLTSLAHTLAAVRRGDAITFREQLLTRDLNMSPVQSGAAQLQAHLCRLSPLLGTAAVAYAVRRPQKRAARTARASSLCVRRLAHTETPHRRGPRGRGPLTRTPPGMALLALSGFCHGLQMSTLSALSATESPAHGHSLGPIWPACLPAESRWAAAREWALSARCTQRSRGTGSSQCSRPSVA